MLEAVSAAPGGGQGEQHEDGGEGGQTQQQHDVVPLRPLPQTCPAEELSGARYLEVVTVVELDPGDGLRGGEGDVEEHAAHLAAPRQRGHGLGHRHQQPGGGHLEDNDITSKCASYRQCLPGVFIVRRVC